jgi:hypothetical protein
MPWKICYTEYIRLKHTEKKTMTKQATIDQCKAWHSTRDQRNAFAATQFTSVTVNSKPTGTPIPARRQFVLDPAKVAEAQAHADKIREELS